MAKLPVTPPTIGHLQYIGPKIHEIPPGEDFVRAFRQGGAHPCAWNTFRRFGPVNARFDHHRPPKKFHPDRAIFYAASCLTTCIAEAFQDTRTIHLTRHAPWLVVFETSRKLQLLDLTGSWPTRVGASMKINSGPRNASRAWSRQFYEAFPTIDGIYYSSSMHANQPCIALYERAENVLPAIPIFLRPLSEPSLQPDLKRAAQTIGYGIIPL